MQIKYDLKASDCMIREHAIWLSLNSIFGIKVWRCNLFSKLVIRLQCLLQCKLHFEIFCKKLSYDQFIILIMCNSIWESTLIIWHVIKKGGDGRINSKMMTINSFEKREEKKKISMTCLNEKMMNLTRHNENKTKIIVETLAITS